MTEHIVAAAVMLWFCVGWPGLAFVVGRSIGRHGLKHAFSLLLIRIAGSEGFTNDAN